MVKFAVALTLSLSLATVVRAEASSNEEAIQVLIERLGAAEYAQREQAQEELRELGVVAFEALHAAQTHPDVEIRKQAEYLLRAIRISWVQDEDPDEVREILRNYRSEEFDQRAERLRQLGRVEVGGGLEALCRLARFETSDVLSRRAALVVMRSTPAEDGLDRDRIAEIVRRVIGNSQRAAARWLAIYARGLADPESTLAEWKAAMKSELAELERQPDKDRLAVLGDFLRWRIERLQELGRDDDMLATMQDLLPLQGSSREDVLDTMDWLIDRRAWSLVEVLARRFPRFFEEDPRLMYRRAEVMAQLGQSDEAEALAKKVLEIPAGDQPFLHVELAYDLQSRGLFDWAEREYRLVIETDEQGTHPPVEAAYRLGYMFHDLARHEDAYLALKQLVDLMEEDKVVMRRAQELNHVPLRIRSQMHFSHALHLAQQPSEPQQKKQLEAELEEALKYDQENADILIAMYRVPDPEPEWLEKTKQRVDRLREIYAQRVASAERDYETLPGQMTGTNLARQLNQFAWLIANTYGDFQAAVQASERSLQLIPDEAGYLDTLGRCYFAVADLDNAIKHQRCAVELEPHSGQISRQLEFFERMAAEPSALK